MSDTESRHLPTEINLHRKSRLLSVAFNDGARFELPCEYLRVFSTAAEVRASPTPATGKESVNIDRIEPQGQYAIRLVFDDGHDTGIYSWETLYQLGQNQAENWARYLNRLEELGISRRPDVEGTRRVQLLYFAYLARKLRKEVETLDLPPTVDTVRALLAWLRQLNPPAAPLFADDQVRVTVNKQFAEPFTRLSAGDEIALVPTSPVAPATPDLV